MFNITTPVLANQFSIELPEKLDPEKIFTINATGINVDFLKKRFEILIDFSYNDSFLRFFTKLLDKCDKMEIEKRVDRQIPLNHITVKHFNPNNHENIIGFLELERVEIDNFGIDFNYSNTEQLQNVKFEGSYSSIVVWNRQGLGYNAT